MKRSTSVATLCMVTFLQAYLLVSVFPYAAFMVVLLWNETLQHPTKRQRGEIPPLIVSSDDVTQNSYQARKLSIGERMHGRIPQTITVEEAGPYAALLATSFMIGRTIAALIWGHLADIYGRRWVLLVSLIGSGFSSLRFGMVTRYGGLSGAVVARGVVGAWNSIVGVSKTLATELAAYDFENNSSDDDDIILCRNKDNGYTEVSQECQQTRHSGQIDDHHNNQAEQQISQEKTETRIVGLVMSMRAWGFLVAPALAGYLADPLNVRTSNADGAKYDADERSHSILYDMLEAYPYLLPNLLGAILCWITALAVFFCIPETLPESRSALMVGNDCLNWVSAWCRTIHKNTVATAGRIFTTSSASEDETSIADRCYGSTEYSANFAQEELNNETTLTAIWSRRNTRYHLIAYWLYSMIIIAIDEAFPLYCISRNNGLHGLSESDIGEILSLSGLIFSLAQYNVYLLLVDGWGVKGSLYFGFWIGILPIILIPIASMFANIQYGSLVYLSLIMGITKIFQSAFFSSITIATNRTIPGDMRSRVNGLGGMGAGIAKGTGPILAGFWLAYCLHWDGNRNEENEGLNVPMGSLVAFGGIACLGSLLLIFLPLLEDEGPA